MGVQGSRVSAKAQTTMTAEWSPPAFDNGSPVTFYEVQWYRSDDESGTSRTEKVPIKADGTTYLGLASLKGGTSYKFRCRASNAIGAGPWGEVVEARTDPGPPDTPTMPRLVSKSNSHASFEWHLPADNGAAITRFDAQLRQMENTGSDGHGGGPGDWVTVSVGTALRRTESPLRPNTKYRFRVRAFNSVGPSPAFSPEIEVKTDPGTPDALAGTGPRETSVAAREASVEWTAPHNNGAAISRYEVSYAALSKENGKGTSATSSNSESGRFIVLQDIITGTTAELTGLTPWTFYSVRVRAKNSVGWAPYGPILQIRTEPDVPDPCLPPNVTSATARSLKTKWSKPKSNGRPITLYNLEYKLSEVVAQEDAAARAAATAAKWGPERGVVSVNVSVANLLAAASAMGQGSAASALQFTAAKLFPASPYSFRIRALNELGFSDWSAPQAEGYTLADVPDMPLQPRCGDSRPLDVVVSWTRPYHNGQAITEFQLQYAPQKQAGQTAVGDSLMDTKYEVTVSTKNGTVAVTGANEQLGSYRLGGSEHWAEGSVALKPLTEYFVAVRARNKVGWSRWSARVGCLTQSESVVGTNIAKIETTHVSCRNVHLVCSLFSMRSRPLHALVDVQLCPHNVSMYVCSCRRTLQMMPTPLSHHFEMLTSGSTMLPQN